MPVENERKYILRSPEQVRALWPDDQWNTIKQGYLRGDARIRSEEQDFFHTKLPELTFTYKIMVGEELIEIETELSDEDFDKLWTVADRKIHKLRYTYLAADGAFWAVDLLLRPDGSIYYALAEAELDKDLNEPFGLLPELEPFVAYLVPRERQEEFTNARLSDPEYAASLKLG